MLIGHTGRTRVEEVILGIGLSIIAIRTMAPIGAPGVYGQLWIKLVFGVLIDTPAVLLLFARSLPARRTALFWVFVTYAYVGGLVPIVDWTRFGTAAAMLSLAGIAGYLYFVTAREIKWTQEQSPRSSPPSGPG